MIERRRCPFLILLVVCFFLLSAVSGDVMITNRFLLASYQERNLLIRSQND